MIILTPILIAFTLIGMSIWGQFLDSYKDFDDALISILFFTLGHTDIEQLLRYNNAWATIFIIVFFLFVIYFMLPVFAAIYTDSYRQTVF